MDRTAVIRGFDFDAAVVSAAVVVSDAIGTVRSHSLPLGTVRNCLKAAGLVAAAGPVAELVAVGLVAAGLVVGLAGAANIVAAFDDADREVPDFCRVRHEPDPVEDESRNGCYCSYQPRCLWAKRNRYCRSVLVSSRMVSTYSMFDAVSCSGEALFGYW